MRRGEEAVTRLLICDDSAEARRSLKELLTLHPGIEVVGEAKNGAEAVSFAVALEPDVVLMDVAMPVLDGVAATRSIREYAPRARVVALAGSDDMEHVTAMIEAGASDYCVKGSPLWELERAIAGASDPLVRLAQELARWANRGSLGDYAAREVAALAGATFATVYLLNPDERLSLAGVAGPAPASAREAVPRLARSAFDARAMERAAEKELGELGVDDAVVELLAVPLVSEGEGLGVVLVALPDDAAPYAERVLPQAADLVAATVASERRFALTFAEARSDPLTGLPNRRAFDEHLDAAIRSAAAEDGEVAIALLDLDDFKQVNDSEGHLVGDRVLVEVARTVLRNLRADEEAFRIGGEEFAIVIRGGPPSAAAVSERVRAALARRQRGQRLPTISAGAASFPRDAQTKEELLRKADTALYVAKWAGKDRVEIYRGGLEHEPEQVAATLTAPTETEAETGRLRILLVDDDDALRLLLRTTLDVMDIEVDEADCASAAAERIAAQRPDVVVLDVSMPGLDGLSFCRQLKDDPATANIAVVLLSGSDSGNRFAARAAGADAFLSKPFSPLELLSVVERVAAGRYHGPFEVQADKPPDEQLLLYAHDLRRLLEVERGQRSLLERAYRETVGALATALESKDTGTGLHSQRVQRYATELAAAIDPSLAADPSVEYGFLLHDVGKIGIPDRLLQKVGPLSARERSLMQTHTVLGDQMLGGVRLLQGEGRRVVRSHHERWDGRGYPDGLAGPAIPLAARIFAVADALDAMTSDRPYRKAGAWEVAVAEIGAEAGHQFDPTVVRAFLELQPRLRRIHYELAAA
jgi:ribonuclease P protein subunit RPR2